MKKLGFVGGGNMAEALVRGLIGRRVYAPGQIIVSDIDASRRRKLTRRLGVKTTSDNSEIVREAEAIVLAVKPHNAAPVARELGGALGELGSRRARTPRQPKRKSKDPANRLLISIAAGITLSRLAAWLGPKARLVRVMPNAPAMVGQGMAAIVRGPGASRADEAFTLRIFRAVGDAVALKDERLLDAVTALSGSGPAYVYLFVKALTEAGTDEGLPAALALRMALQTLRGAEKNMRRSTMNAAELIRVVASPGGTTEAALLSFERAGFSDIVKDSVRAAAARSRELAKAS